MNEMASGCCVCSDERGWTENPLVYCDGVGCNIGVHKACYGIVSVPSGNWYCKKCESQERSARVRCELCPSKDGALKRTDNNGWAHVICGLYIPEVRFGSVVTMEPILLSQIPAERFNKVCYICELSNRGRASVGACMQCNKAGCKQQFHVTCAQALGLLCEEPGNFEDNVKYCGYCQEHYLKIRKNSNVKTIPPYKPVSNHNSTPEESPEKKIANLNELTNDLKQTTKRKSVCNRPSSVNGSSRLSNKELPNQQSSLDNVNKVRSLTSPSPSSLLQVVKERTSVTNNEPAINNVSSLSQITVKSDSDSRFTTSNFVESVITPSESVFAEVQKNNKKRKIYEATSMTSPPVTLSPVVTALSSQQLLKQQQSLVAVTTTASVITPEFLIQGVACSSSKLNSNFEDTNNDGGDDEDDDSDELKFIEEPNLSTLNLDLNTSTASTSESTTMSGVPMLPIASESLDMTLSSNNFHTNNPSVSTHKTPVSSAKSHVNVSTPNPVTYSYLSVASSADNSNKKLAKFQNGSHAPHMLGNQLNPASSMAQRMFDSLNDEVEAHSIFTTNENASPSNFVGPPLYNKIISSTRTKDSFKKNDSLSSNNGPLASLSGSAANFPQTLEELLEKQWEQGGTFLMEQAQHFDIASLLTCLHKLREENLELEEHICKLKARRDHLLGVNARLAMPLAPISQPVNNMHSLLQTSPKQSPVSTSIVAPPHSLHQQISQQTQAQVPHQSLTVQQVQLQPSTPHQNAPRSQMLYHSANTNSLLYNSVGTGNNNNSFEDSQLRNIPLPSSISMLSGSINLRSPQGSAHQNLHSLENDPLLHHQHAQAMPVMSAAGNTRLLFIFIINLLKNINYFCTSYCSDLLLFWF